MSNVTLIVHEKKKKKMYHRYLVLEPNAKFTSFEALIRAQPIFDYYAWLYVEE